MGKRLVSDNRLEVLILSAEERLDGGYWTRAYQFLRGLRGVMSITKAQHNWLHEIQQKLSNPWD